MPNVIHTSFGIISEELFAYHSHAYVHVLLRFLLLILYISILHWETSHTCMPSIRTLRWFDPFCKRHCTLSQAKLLYNISVQLLI